MKSGIEIWEKIPDTKNLFISNSGRILSMAQGIPKILSGKKNKKGYIRLMVNGRMVFVHRIVAEVFLKPPKEGQIQINHINGDKSDNRAINIEWRSPSENLYHSWKMLGRSNNKKREETRFKKKRYNKSNRHENNKHDGNIALGRNPRAIKTGCYETGEVFSCGVEAALKMGVPKTAVMQSIYTGSTVRGKYHFYQIKETKEGEKKP